MRDDQLRTIRSLKDIYGDGSFYSMAYYADYRLDDILKLNEDNWGAFENGVVSLLAGGESGTPADGAAGDTSRGDGCTVFMVKDREGHVLVGRNFDFRHRKVPGVTRGSLLLRTEPKGDFRSFGMVDQSFGGFTDGHLTDEESDLGPLMLTPYTLMDGMNEKGVFIAILALAHPGVHQETGKPRAVPTLAMRAVLDRASSTAEAVDIYKSFDMHISMAHKSFQFFVADRSGQSAVIEYSESDMYVVDSPLVTNFYLVGGISRKEEGRARYETAKALMDYRGNVMEKEEVMAVLRLISQPAAGRENSDTLWSAVFDLTSGEADIVAAHRYDRPVHFSLSENFR